MKTDKLIVFSNADGTVSFTRVGMHRKAIYKPSNTKFPIINTKEREISKALYFELDAAVLRGEYTVEYLETENDLLLQAEAGARTAAPNSKGVMQKGVPDTSTTVGFKSEAELPVYDEYRNALTFDGAKVCHDMIKAREICLKSVRRIRDKKMEALDKDEFKFISMNDATNLLAVRSKKQTLRDIPQNIQINVNGATDTNGLKSVIAGIVWP